MQRVPCAGYGRKQLEELSQITSLNQLCVACVHLSVEAGVANSAGSYKEGQGVRTQIFDRSSLTRRRESAETLVPTQRTGVTVPCQVLLAREPEALP
jgi:hypothetical protein